jgi:putative FmdB family regulatory protein
VLYEYRHNGQRKRNCPKTFELMRSIPQRDAPAPCPKCGSTETERLKFQAFAIVGGAEPDVFGGDGEPEDFGGFGDDDFGDDDFDF